MLGSYTDSNSAYTVLAGLARGLLITAAAVAIPALASAQSAEAASDPPSFFVLDNTGDPSFNQLLGINDGRIIVGYFGDGTTITNRGYVLVPPNHYSAENFLINKDPAPQTQAIGINNKNVPDIVGFYTDAAGVTHGFFDNGVMTPIDDPAGSAPHVTTPLQNLLGINTSDEAAGFWTDNNNHEHGFIVHIDTKSPTSSTFTEIPPSTFPGAVATQASDITDEHEICGFWTDAKGNNHGFSGQKNHFVTFDVKIGGMTATSTSPFGCNNRGEIVGSFTDSKGNVHGFLAVGNRFSQFDATGSSQTAAFNVMGTFINGVNDDGDIVGFFSDGHKVNGFVNFTHRNDDPE